MNRTLIQGKDGALSDALAGILGRLQGRGYSRFRSEDDLHLEADGFVKRLADHFRQAEGTLFPALRKFGSESACDIEELEKDHQLLGLYARDLATQIKERGGERFCGMARTFLAVLLDHLHRETASVGRCVNSLNVLDAEHLGDLIERCWPPGAGEPRVEPTR